MDKAMEQMKANKNVLPSGIYGSTAPNQFIKIGPNAKKEIVKIVNSVNQTQMNDKFWIYMFMRITCCSLLDKCQNINASINTIPSLGERLVIDITIIIIWIAGSHC